LFFVGGIVCAVPFDSLAAIYPGKWVGWWALAISKIKKMKNEGMLKEVFVSARAGPRR